MAFQSPVSKKRLFVAVFLTAALLMLILNFFTPLIADDYSYHFSWKDQSRITTLGDVFVSMYAHYFKWGGRVVTHLIATLFLLIGKPFFNLANTAVYLWLSLLIYRFITVKQDSKYHPSLYLLVHLGLWFALPAYGQNVFWLVGSCNYMWPAAFLLAFLWPIYQYCLAGKAPVKKVFLFLYPLLGLLAGWGNENTSGAGILFTFLLLFLIKKEKKTLPAWTLVGTAGQILGFLLMMAAPGNYLRLESSMEETGLLLKYATRLGICNFMIYEYLLYILLAYLFLLVLLFYSKQEKSVKYIAVFFGICSLACNYVMIATPEYPERAALGSALFLVLGLLFCAALLIPQWPPKWTSAVTVCLAGLFCLQLIYAGLDMGYTYRLNNRRAAFIIEQRDAGVMDVVTYRIEPKTKWNALYGLEDLQGYTTHWLNGNTSNYFGIHTIVAFPEEEADES
ncbi:MAG: hypothetical protein HFI30_00115 [Lachnospiraceae bacterium]|jgi:hypothetical protein|nr:hypothetical protein [Lachnospiraceae bacterium]